MNEKRSQKDLKKIEEMRKEVSGDVSDETILALIALKVRRQCGWYAAAGFAANNGVTGLYRIARQLSATQHV